MMQHPRDGGWESLPEPAGEQLTPESRPFIALLPWQMSQPQPGFYKASRVCARSGQELSQPVPAPFPKPWDHRGGWGAAGLAPPGEGSGGVWCLFASQEPFQRGQEQDLGSLVASRVSRCCVLTEGTPARAELFLSPPEHSRDSSRVAHAAGIVLPSPQCDSRDRKESPLPGHVPRGEDWGAPAPLSPPSPRPDTFPVSN